MENNKDEILDAMEDFDVLDEIEFEGATYFAMTPIEGKEAEGEVFIMKLVDIDGAEMLESVIGTQTISNISVDFFVVIGYNNREVKRITEYIALRCAYISGHYLNQHIF